MRLELPFPGDWTVGASPDGRVRAVVPGHAAEPDLLVLVSPVRPLPALIDAGFLAAELGCAIDDAGEERGSRGWPVTLIRGARLDPDGAVIERRLAAIYRLLDRYATALVVGRDPGRWTAEVAGLGEIVLAGDLDWGEEPASLAEILSCRPNGDGRPDPT